MVLDVSIKYILSDLVQTSLSYFDLDYIIYFRNVH